MSTHTVKIGGEWRHNRDMLLQTQDAGGSRGRFSFNAVGHRRSPPSRIAEPASPTRSRRSCSTGRTRVQRDLKVIDEPGTQHMGDRSSSCRTNGRRDRTSRSTSACAGSTTRRSRASRARARWPTTIRRRTRCASPATATTNNALNVKSTFTNFAPRTGVSWRLEREDGRSRRLRREHDSVPGQPLRVQLSGQAELLRARRRTDSSAPGSMAAGLPGAGRCSNIPPDGIIPVDRQSLLNSTLRRHPAGPARGHAAFVERRVPAAAAVSASRPTSPTSATAASTW